MLNRLLRQAAVDCPQTARGSGGQTRAFIHIQDTVRCIQVALENSPRPGGWAQIFNQMTKTRRLRDLVQMIAERTGVRIDFVPNPRNETDENDLHVRNDRFLALEPIILGDGLMEDVTDIACKCAYRRGKSKISQWWQTALGEAEQPAKKRCGPVKPKCLNSLIIANISPERHGSLCLLRMLAMRVRLIMHRAQRPPRFTPGRYSDSVPARSHHRRAMKSPHD